MSSEQVDALFNVVGVLAGIGLFFWIIIKVVEELFTSPTPQSQPRTAEDLQREAEWYRAEEGRLKAIAEYERAQAELTQLRHFVDTELRRE